MRYTTTVDVDAPGERVWKLLSDVSSWPRWTPTVTAVRADPGELALGMRVELTQPGRRPTEYVVDELVAGRRFRWSRVRGGVRQHADHVVTPAAPGRCTVTFTFEMGGPLGDVLGRLGGTTIRRMVDQEAASLTRHAEAP